jgi:hypothetical protein
MFLGRLDGHMNLAAPYRKVGAPRIPPHIPPEGNTVRDKMFIHL